MQPEVPMHMWNNPTQKKHVEPESATDAAHSNSSGYATVFLYTHTLDKNGSLYDPAGTESWNMQIRYENNEINDASYE